jgi:hypothetical protein
MNAALVRPEEPKLLAASEDGAVSNSLPEPLHDSGPEHSYTIEEIHIRAKTLTPLLKEILDFLPAPCCGIKE